MCSWDLRPYGPQKYFKKWGGFEENFKSLYEDQVFYAKMALNHRIYVDENLSSKYRNHLESACYKAEKAGGYNSKGGPNKAESVYLQWLSEYIHQKGSKDPNLNPALKDRRFPYDHPILFKIDPKWRNFCGRFQKAVK